MSSRGQIVIPQEVRERCQLREGAHFLVEDNPDTQVVVLRKVKREKDWFSVYMQCPEPFPIPSRRRQLYKALLRNKCYKLSDCWRGEMV